MGRPKGSKNKSKSTSPIRVVAPPEDVDDVEEGADEEQDTDPKPPTPTAKRPESPDLDIATIYDGINDLKRVEENIVDIKRTLNDLEGEFGNIKADYAKRIKTVKAVLDDNIAGLERLTHTEVFDRKRGQVYLVHNSKVAAAEDLIQTIAECDDDEEREDWIQRLDGLAKTARAIEFDDSQEALPFAAEG
jgi:hypothetical protein